MPRSRGVAVLAALMLLGTGCGAVLEKDRSDAGSQGDVTSDLPPALVDQTQPPKPDASPVKCAPGCPAASGNNVCLAGKALQFSSLAAMWSGLVTHATPLAVTDGAHLSVLDPIAFVAGTVSQPLATATITTGGCWVAKQASIPFSGLFAIATDDDPSSKLERWVLTATGETPQPGTNSEGLEIAALANNEVKAWTTELGADPVSAGAMIVVFVDKNGQAVSGVTPQLAGAPPPWTGSGVHFFADDVRKAPVFDNSATATTKSGMALILNAPVKTFSGKKGSCAIEAGLGGSTPGALFIRIFKVSGC